MATPGRVQREADTDEQKPNENHAAELESCKRQDAGIVSCAGNLSTGVLAVSLSRGLCKRRGRQDQRSRHGHRKDGSLHAISPVLVESSAATARALG